MMALNFTERFGEATARIDKLIWIPSAVGAWAWSDDLKSMVEDLYDNNEQIISRLPMMRRILTSEDEPEEEDVIEVLHRVNGFFAKLARPIPQMLGTRHAYSWGYYQTEWVYAETLEELAKLAEDFSERVVADAKSSAA